MKNEIIKRIEDESGIVGFASIDRFDNLNIENHPRYYLKNCKTVIVLGLKVPKDIYFVENQKLHFIQRSNHIVFNNLDIINHKILSYLESKKCKSIPIPSFMPLKLNGLYPQGLISLKNAAIQAGLGNVGKNDIVYNKKFGGFIRFSAILTEAEIEPDNLVNEKICNENCMICIKSCPAKAITKSGYDRKKCFNKTFAHGLKPAMLFNLRKAEMFMNTSFHNYWSSCCECSIKCPLNKN